MKKTILIDFDGVIHSYSSGWSGINTIRDKPVEGSFKFLEECLNRFEVYIYSTRCETEEGIAAMIRWFKVWEFNRVDDLRFTYMKIPAWLTIDDRTFQFNGIFPTVEEIDNFKPWNKK